MLLEKSTVNDYLIAIEKAIKALDFSAKPNELYDPMKYTLGLGGKRIRPLLVLLGNELFEGNLKSAMPAALAVEVMHNFTLIHDDIMDEAPTRRGKDSVHQKWGRDIAILSGDAMFVRAYQLLEACPQDKLSEIFKVFNYTVLKVCEGQQLDMNFEVQPATINDYLYMISLKTAELLAGSLKLGAIIGKANQEEVQHLYDFGKNIGIAFQLMDDLLDLYADPKKFGKQVGGDIIANKKTFLVLKALELAEGNTLNQLNELLESTKISDNEKIVRVKAIFDQLNMKQQTEELIDQYYTKAFNNLATIPVSEVKKNNLKQLISNLINRGY